MSEEKSARDANVDNQIARLRRMGMVLVAAIVLLPRQLVATLVVLGGALYIGMVFLRSLGAMRGTAT